MRLLVLDACVLIDLFDSDPSIIRTISEHVGPVHVASPVFDEVEQIDAVTAESLGLKVVDPSVELAMTAAAQRGGLTFQDWLCLLLAKERGWTCVTNDKRLRSECGTQEVPVLWGLELVALVVEAGGMSVAEASELGQAIVDANPHIRVRVLRAFKRRIRSRQK
jgi:predicted nucleic acid-binding protein